MRHSLTLAVRHYECDAYNHVNNATYLNYLEYAREITMQDWGLDYPAWIAEGKGIWVAEAHLVYHSPALGGEVLTIETEPSELGGAWAVLHQQISASGRLVLDAHVKLVWVGAGGKPTRIPPEWKQRFTAV